MDVDGTLVDYEGRIPQSAVRAVRAARKNGHLAYICTGRSEAEVYEEIWAIGLDGMIGGNGSYVKSQGEVLLHETLSEKQCASLVEWMEKRNLEYYLECNSGLYASRLFRKTALPALAEYAGREHADESFLDEVFPDMIYGASTVRSDVNKISFVLSSFQDYLDAKSAFPDLQVGTWGGKGEHALFGDFSLPGISKEKAIGILLEHLGADKKDAIAFGDAKVDIPMFHACGCSVAMGSGGKECREAADYVTGDVEKDGLYQAFVHLKLI